ncbi:MAG: sugar-binding protein [Lentisphaeria bacterium]
MKRNIRFSVICFFLLFVLGLSLFRGKIIDFAGLKLTGAEVEQVFPFVDGSSNLIPGDSSFETGFGTLTGGDWQDGSYEIDPTTGGDKKQSLKINGNISSIPIATEPGKTYIFSLYAKADKDNVKAGLYLINPGWKQTVRQEIVLHKEWGRYFIKMKATQRDYWLGFSGAGWVDAYQFEEGNKPTPYKNKEPVSIGCSSSSEYQYVFFPDEKIELNFSVVKAWKDADITDLDFSYQIIDFYKNIVKRGEKKITLNEEGRYKEMIPFQAKKLGFFSVRYQFKRKGQLIYSCPEKDLQTFAVIKPPVKIEKGLEPFCGICGYKFPALKRIGVHWVDTGFHWKDIEQTKGKYNWSRLDGLSSYKKRGYKNKVLLGHFPSTPEWSWDEEEAAEMKEKKIQNRFGLLVSKKYLKNWQEFIHRFAVRYKDVIDIYEIGGEDDLTLGHNPFYRQKYPKETKNSFVIAKPVMDRYAEMVTVAINEIRKVTPNAKIAIIRPSGLDSTLAKPRYAFSKEILKRIGNKFDLFSLDCYCFPPRYLGPDGDSQLAKYPTLESLLPDSLNKALAVTQKYGAGQHVYISEFGYALDVGEPYDSEYVMEIVKRLSRTFLIARMTANVDYCNWFVARGVRENRKYEYGLWRNGCPMAMVPAYSAVAGVVENVIEAKEILLGGDVKAVVFNKPNNKAVSAIWVARGKGRIAIPVNSEQISIVDVMGNLVKPEIKEGEVAFEIGEFPVYLRLSGKENFKNLCAIMSSARLQIIPLKVYFATSETKAGTVCLQNQLNQDLMAHVSFLIGEEVLNKTVPLPKREKTFVKFPLPEDIIDRKEEVKITVDCGKEFEKIISSFPIEFNKIMKTSSSIKIDGDLSEWKDHPYILMNKRKQILPPDPWVNWSGPKDLSAKVYLGWDRENFYFAAEITDDKQFNNESLSDIWNGDSIQFALDSLADAYLSENGAYGADDYNLGVALTKKGPRTYQWHGSAKKLWEESEFAVVRNETSKKTFYEIKIPLAYLNIPAKQGAVFGFNFVIFDDDEGGGQTYWYQLTPGTANGVDLRYFKKFVLMEK